MLKRLRAHLPRPARFLPNRIPVYDPEAVTQAGDEVDPRSVGLTEGQVDTMWAAVVRMYCQGLHPAISICLRYRGQVILNRAIGHARGNGPKDPPDGEKVLATPNTLFNLFSGSKAVTAMVVHLLNERGLIHLDDAVAEYIPEFTGHGKERITLRHVLLHRAGIPAVPEAHANPDLLMDPSLILDLLCQAEPESDAGRHAAYHAVNGGFILAEVIKRASGRYVQSWLKEEIRDPLGFTDFTYGVPVEKLPLVARESFTGPKPRLGLDRFLARSIGMGMLDAVELSNDPRFRTAVIPAGNIIGTADEVCRFFELILRGGELDGVRCFEERTIRRAVAEGHEPEMDRIIFLPLRYSLGFMLGGDRMSFYGRNTPKAFGHLGFTNVLAWADPERDISVALMNNGKPFVSPSLLAWLAVPKVIAQTMPRSVSS